MKKSIRALAIVLTLLMVLPILGAVASAENTVVSFSDVKKTHWGYDTIMSMTRKGLFKGMTEPVNGVGEFWPERTMTRAEFVTVSVRTMYPKESGKVKNQTGNWWKGYYDLALEKGILLPNELDKGALNKSMSRQEMAMVMVRCVEKNGEVVSSLVSTDKIADYSRISSTYQSYVRKCFSLGLIVGIDSKGAFAPTTSLTRAQAATVLCRLIDKSTRVNVTEEEEEVELPWENGGKQPKDYSWAEFEALTPALQIAFQNTFKDFVAFEAWMEQARSNNSKNPWDKTGAKQPKDYSWEEFEALTPAQQIAFQNSFSASAAFEQWMLQAQADAAQNPWDKTGAKQPKDYSWKEFEALTPTQQIAFQNSFVPSEAFEEWMLQAQAGTSQNPWDKSGAKQPKDYSWEEFEALTPAQQIAFQNSFGSMEKFDKWLSANQPE